MLEIESVENKIETKNDQSPTKVIEKKEKIESNQVIKLPDQRLSDSTGASPNTLKIC
ncbi:MAG: hypothetical protein ACJ0Q7_02935 [Pelagibacteraceae bacterium]